MKIVIISNRLPVTIKEEDGKLAMSRSSGGLATGLSSLETKSPLHWVGWCGTHIDGEEQRQQVETELAKQNLHPVYLSEHQIEDFYEGYSNSTIWPLCHYFYSYIEYDDCYWHSYREVNTLFCQEAIKVIEPGDLVWIHDYQLMLLPAMIRNAVPDVGIGYFHHIPFPSYELFRSLPERADILNGLLGADLIGFHTHDYMRHFISAVYRVLNLECTVDQVRLQDRVAETDAFPMGINYDLYHDSSLTPAIKEYAAVLRQLAGERKIILSVDRLDYSKGILTRLKGYEQFLENHPEFAGKVTYIMVVVPSRDSVEMYGELKTAIDKQVGAINGKYSNVEWTPVHYFYRSFPFDQLAGMYQAADIALVMPLRDGMNLVAKEYVASKRDQSGVLILSEMAGAADELRQAIIVNPTDIKHIENALVSALTMPEDKQREAMGQMQELLSCRTVNVWAKEFMDELRAVKKQNDDLKNKLLNRDSVADIRQRFINADNRLLVFDYDGTLTPLVSDPAKAIPSPEVSEALDALASDPANTVVICSGRKKAFLDQWFPNPALRMSAEHGAFFRENGEWEGDYGQLIWADDIMDIVQNVAARTPGSHIENKQTSLVWHYRDVNPWLADLRVNQLISALMRPLARDGLQIMRGKKIVEIKARDFNKGQVIAKLINGKSYQFVMAVGDDVTDEDMFSVLGKDAVTIKVGQFSDIATYCVADPQGVLSLISGCANQGNVTRIMEEMTAVR